MKETRYAGQLFIHNVSFDSGFEHLKIEKQILTEQHGSIKEMLLSLKDRIDVAIDFIENHEE